MCKEDRDFKMSIRGFIVFYTLTISFISFITVVFTLTFELESCLFIAAWPLLTNFISLFYNYLSIEIDTYRVSFV
jgi:hypothetical protein